MEEYINIYRELAKVIEERIRHYEDGVKRLDDAWLSYRNSVNDLKREWDSEYPIIKARVNQIKSGIENLKNRIEEAEVKREIGLIDDETYNKLINDLNRAIDELGKLYDEVNGSLNGVENRIMNHWLRSIDVASMSQRSIEDALKSLEEARSNGQISEETYGRLKRDLEMLNKAIQAYSLLIKE